MASEHHVLYIVNPTLAKILGNIKGKTVLDLACGEGRSSRFLKNMGAKKVVGIDISHKMIQLAKEQERKNRQGIKYYVFDAVKMPRIGGFDLVVGVFLLHYSKTKKEMLGMCQTAYKNLKKGGRFVSLNNNPKSPLRFDKKYNFTRIAKLPLKEGDKVTVTLYNHNKKDCVFHNYFWKKETYQWALKKSGFKKITWYDTQVSPEGIKKFTKNYWEDFLKHPTYVLIEARN